VFWKLGAPFKAINLAWISGVVALATVLGKGRTARVDSLKRVAGLASIGCAALVLLAP
jgi:hypothetical protein